MIPKLLKLKAKVESKIGVNDCRSSGRVMFVICCQRLAPSMLAASYRSSLMVASALMVAVIMYGKPSHRFTNRMLILAHSGSFSQGTANRPSSPSVLLTMPKFWSSSAFHICTLMTAGIAQGKNSSVR